MVRRLGFDAWRLCLLICHHNRCGRGYNRNRVMIFDFDCLRVQKDHQTVLITIIILITCTCMITTLITKGSCNWIQFMMMQWWNLGWLVDCEVIWIRCHLQQIYRGMTGRCGGGANFGSSENTFENYSFTNSSPKGGLVAKAVLNYEPMRGCGAHWAILCF